MTQAHNQPHNPPHNQPHTRPQSQTSFLVHFDNIMVNTIGTNAGIFVGTNVQYGWSSHNKTNASISSVTGDRNEFRDNLNVIYDNDVIDNPIDDRDVFFDARNVTKAS